MKRNIENLTSHLLLLTALLIISGCGSNDISKSSQVLARVGNKEITTTYFDRQVSSLPETVQKLSTNGDGKKAIVEALVNRELLYAAALEKKIDKAPETQKKLDDLKKEFIVNTYLQNELNGKLKVDDKEIENFYVANPAEFKNREEVRISQIVVPDEGKANEIMQKLSIRRDFGELAQAYSADKATAARNGDVGWFTRAKLPENVRDAVFKLKTGEVSKPFKRDNGYEIYRITDRQTVSYQLAQVKEAIRTQLYNGKYQQELKGIVEGLKKTTKVQLNEALLK